MEITQYKKIQTAFEGANKKLVELLDIINELDPNASLFGDISIDLDSCESVLAMSTQLRQMEIDFNREFTRLQTNKMIENRHRIAGTKPEEDQPDLWTPKG
ncbi:hypothetical protein [Vibrio phage CKB-S2]|nr:hypothetical protein [Vibrio phage CKB-S2]